MNRYTAVGSVSPVYDLNGRPISDGARTYEWSTAGRLLRVTDSAREIEAEFSYDAFGRRISRTITRNAVSDTTWFIWDGDRVVEERAVDGTLKAEFLWLPESNRLLSSRRTLDGTGATSWKYAHVNNLGSLLAVTGSDGLVLERLRYTAYGVPELLNADGTSAADPNAGSAFSPFLYTGHVWEKDLEFFYAKVRWYDPSRGRFISPSPLTYPVAELNYLYCWNNPVSYFDPDGLLPTAAELADRWDAGADNYLAENPTGSFAGDMIQGMAVNFTRLGADLFRLGRGTAEAIEGYSSTGCGGKLTGLDRGLAFAGDMGRGMSIFGGLGTGTGRGAEGLRHLWQNLNRPTFFPRSRAHSQRGTVQLGLYKGGRHGETKGPVGDGLDSHHTPAKSVSPLHPDKGTAIQMDPTDHVHTASHGSQGLAGQLYRDQQLQLIKQGKLDDAIQMDIDDIISKFGSKYDEAILQMIDSL